MRIEKIKRFWSTDEYGRPFWRGATTRDKLKNWFGNGPGVLIFVAVIYFAIEGIAHVLRPLLDSF